MAIRISSALSACALVVASSLAQAGDTIKVGVNLTPKVLAAAPIVSDSRS